MWELGIGILVNLFFHWKLRFFMGKQWCMEAFNCFQVSLLPIGSAGDKGFESGLGSL